MEIPCTQITPTLPEDCNTFEGHIGSGETTILLFMKTELSKGDVHSVRAQKPSVWLQGCNTVEKAANYAGLDAKASVLGLHRRKFQELNRFYPMHIVLAGISHRHLLVMYTMQKLFTESENVGGWKGP